MRVALLSAPEQVRLADVPPPVPAPGQVLVQIRACALCTFEQRAYLGAQRVRLPFVGGHETVGHIVRLEPPIPVPLALGDLVAIGPDHCGQCDFCRAGHTARCPRAFGSEQYPGLHGPMGLSEYMAVDARRVFAFPRAIPLEEAVFAEPLSCAIHAARRARIRPGDDIAVLGAGTMGLLNLQVARQRGARVFVSDLLPERLEKASQLGADAVVSAAEGDPVERVRALTDGAGVDVAVAAIGSGEVNRQGLAMLRPRGRLVLFASAHPPEPLQIDPNVIHGDELTIVGSVSKDVSDFRVAVRLLAYRQVDVRPLVHAVMPFDEIERAFTVAVQPRTYRVVVSFPDGHASAPGPRERGSHA